MIMSNWLPPINLFSVPRQEKICHHTHWAVYYSFRMQQCVDCGEKRNFNGMKIVHQR